MTRRFRDCYLRGERKQLLSPQEQLNHDLANAFDRIHELRLKLWMLLFLLGIEGAVIRWLATELVKRLH